MAIELVKCIWCDVCLHERDERREAAASLPMSPSETVAPRVVDLCERCAASTSLVALLALAAEHGRPVQEHPAPPSRPDIEGEPRRRGRKKVTDLDLREVCVVCWETVPGASAWKTHMHRQHGFPPKVGISEFMSPPWRCPLCGSESPKISSVASHCASSHKRRLTACLGVAREQGDPYGVVASLRDPEEVRDNPGKYAVRDPGVKASMRLRAAAKE